MDAEMGVALEIVGSPHSWIDDARSDRPQQLDLGAGRGGLVAQSAKGGAHSQAWTRLARAAGAAAVAGGQAFEKAAFLPGQGRFQDRRRGRLDPSRQRGGDHRAGALPLGRRSVRFGSVGVVGFGRLGEVRLLMVAEREDRPFQRGVLLGSRGGLGFSFDAAPGGRLSEEADRQLGVVGHDLAGVEQILGVERRLDFPKQTSDVGSVLLGGEDAARQSATVFAGNGAAEFPDPLVNLGGQRRDFGAVGGVGQIQKGAEMELTGPGVAVEGPVDRVTLEDILKFAKEAGEVAGVNRQVLQQRDRLPS